MVIPSVFSKRNINSRYFTTRGYTISVCACSKLSYFTTRGYTISVCTCSKLRYFTTRGYTISVCACSKKLSSLIVHIMLHMLVPWRCYFLPFANICVRFQQLAPFATAWFQSTAHAVAICCKMRVRLMKIFIKTNKYVSDKLTARARSLKIGRNIK